MALIGERRHSAWSCEEPAFTPRGMQNLSKELCRDPWGTNIDCDDFASSWDVSRSFDVNAYGCGGLPTAPTTRRIPSSRCSPIGRAVSSTRETTLRSWASGVYSRSVSSNCEASLANVDCPRFDPWSWGKGFAFGDELLSELSPNNCNGYSWRQQEQGTNHMKGDKELLGPEFWSWVNNLSSPRMEKEAPIEEEFSFPILESTFSDPIPMRREASFQMWQRTDGTSSENGLSEMYEEEDFTFPVSQ